jgi:hypothetical protein
MTDSELVAHAEMLRALIGADDARRIEAEVWNGRAW